VFNVTFVQLPEQSLAAVSWAEVELSATYKYEVEVKNINQTIISKDYTFVNQISKKQPLWIFSLNLK
jgi:hypothetical protein